VSPKTVPDVTQKHWHVELSHEDGWDFVQIASVNEKSNHTLPADDGNGLVLFTGWRVTLDRAGLDELIEEAHNLRARLNAAEKIPSPAQGENAGQRVL
jgi:hypothetical protein